MSKCNLSVQQHFLQIGVALQNSGVNMTCESTYHALIEYAEGLRSGLGFEPHQPSEWSTRLGREAGLDLQMSRLAARERAN